MDFETRNHDNIRRMASDARLKALSTKWIAEGLKYEYSYHFTWLGRPVIQYPQDLMAVQEILWRTRPDLVIETGIARGGSLIYYASILELIGGAGSVLGIDVEIRPQNRIEIEKHPMNKRITMLEGSSVGEEIIQRVREIRKGYRRVLVILDSNHTQPHVSEELRLYAPLVTKGSYLIVLDTIIEDLPEGAFPERPWGKGNNPKTAVKEFLKGTDRFVEDVEIESKLLITVAPGGYLKCVRD